MTLPNDHQARKECPIARGVLDYFPDAVAEIAHVSYVGNQQHNPGEEMHWAREKSQDHADCIVRHLIERGERDEDGMRHAAKAAWRALALLQLEIEAGSDEGESGESAGRRPAAAATLAKPYRALLKCDIGSTKFENEIRFAFTGLFRGDASGVAPTEYAVRDSKGYPQWLKVKVEDADLSGTQLHVLLPNGNKRWVDHSLVEPLYPVDRTPYPFEEEEEEHKTGWLCCTSRTPLDGVYHCFLASPDESGGTAVEFNIPANEVRAHESIGEVWVPVTYLGNRASDGYPLVRILNNLEVTVSPSQLRFD